MIAISLFVDIKDLKMSLNIINIQRSVITKIFNSTLTRNDSIY